MRWIYQWQQRLSLSGPEFRAVAVLGVLLLGGLLFRYVQHDVRPIPEGTYDEAHRLLQQGAHAVVPGVSEPLQDTHHVQVVLPEGRTEHHNLLQGFFQGRLDLNRATEAELELLPRIGPALARRIVAYRSEHGPFQHTRELTQVKGIGAKTLERIEPFLFVQVEKAQEPDDNGGRGGR